MASITNANSVQRVKLGKDGVGGPIQSECGTPGYVLGLGQRPKGARGFLSAVGAPLLGGDTVHKQLLEAGPVLQRNSIPLEKGPYADKVSDGTNDGEVGVFRSEIFAGVQPTEIQRIADRVIDSVRPYHPELDRAMPRTFTSEYAFALNPDFVSVATERRDLSLVLPDKLLCAGDILTQPIRLVENETSGGTFITVTGNLESLLLAVSALRRHGITGAYPAMAVNLDVDPQTNDMVEVYAPLIAIVDMTKDIPLHTFSPFMREHPRMLALDILSDVAMLGATFTMLAETRIKRLALEMRFQAKEFGRPMGDEEVEHQLGRIADALFQCHVNWPNSHLIMGTLGFALETIAGVIASFETGQPIQELKRIASTPPNTHAEANNFRIAHEVLQTAYQIAHGYNMQIRQLLGQKMDAQ